MQDPFVTLKAQQQDFIKRLKSETSTLEHLNSSQAKGCYSELTVISGYELDEIKRYCWKIVDKYFLESRQYNKVETGKYSQTESLEVYVRNLVGKLGELVVKRYLDLLITDIDFDVYDKVGDGGFDFVLVSNPDKLIQVKTRQGKSIDKIKWVVSQDEIKRNDALICLWIQEDISESQSTYHLVNAGFIPMSMLNNKQRLGIQDLLYGGGLKAYLNHYVCSTTFVESEKSRIDNLVLLADQSFANKAYDESLKYCNEILQIDDKNYRAYHLKAEICLSNKQDLEAIKILSDAIEDTQAHELYFFRGVVWSKIADQYMKKYYSSNVNGNRYLQYSIQDYSRAIELEPSFAKAYYHRSRIYLFLGRRQEAIENAWHAMQLLSTQSNLSEYAKIEGYFKEKFTESEIEKYLNPELYEKKERELKSLYDDIPF
uniref:TPR repeat-containing protein n=1 Tax=Cyanothece sp. (strain PCC 7425 / ATCC 29141) TaxID=395961 RepID=B8HUQ2_CYAP4